MNLKKSVSAAYEILSTSSSKKEQLIWQSLLNQETNLEAFLQRITKIIRKEIIKIEKILIEENWEINHDIEDIRSLLQRVLDQVIFNALNNNQEEFLQFLNQGNFNTNTNFNDITFNLTSRTLSIASSNQQNEIYPFMELRDFLDSIAINDLQKFHFSLPDIKKQKKNSMIKFLENLNLSFITEKISEFNIYYLNNVDGCIIDMGTGKSAYCFNAPFCQEEEFKKFLSQINENHLMIMEALLPEYIFQVRKREKSKSKGKKFFERLYTNQAKKLDKFLNALEKGRLTAEKVINHCIENDDHTSVDIERFKLYLFTNTRLIQEGHKDTNLFSHFHQIIGSVMRNEHKMLNSSIKRKFIENLLHQMNTEKQIKDFFKKSGRLDLRGFLMSLAQNDNLLLNTLVGNNDFLDYLKKSDFDFNP